MTKTLSERVEDNVREANAVAAGVKGFRKKTLDAYPGFNYALLQADDPKLYKGLRAVEGRMDKAVGKSLFYLMDLNEKWWDLMFKALSVQEQFEPEIQRMRQIYEKAIAH